MSSELIDQEVAILAERLRTKQLSPVELTKAYLERIGEFDSSLRAYITVSGDLALDRRASANLK